MRRALLISATVLTATLAADDSADAKAWWAHVQHLADDNMEGRKAGSDGHRKAAEYVAREFRKAKLQPGGGNSYFQAVPLEMRQIREQESMLAVVRDGKEKRLELGRSGYVLPRGESGRMVEAEAVFVGYGLRVPEAGIDHLAGLDLKGRIAVVFRGAPKSLPGPLAAHAQSAAEHWRSLREAGAIGVASIYNTNVADIPWERAATARLQPAPSLAIPELVDTTGQQIAITIGPAGADPLLEGTGVTYTDLLAKDKAGQDLPRFPLKVRIRAKASFTLSRVASDNVVGVFPGSDPAVQNQIVVFTAHLDHLGTGQPVKGDRIYNGAMDNASGIATLIEVAKAMSGRKLRRTVAFAAVTAEEGGLLGSKYFASKPPLRGNVVANVNTDMYLPIVPLRGITVYGLAESDLGEIFAEVSARAGIDAKADPEPQRNSFIRSDQYSFIRRGIPALAFRFHTEPDTPEAAIVRQWRTERYHAVTDDLEQPVNMEGAAQFTRIMAAFLEKVANRPDRPEWRPESFFRRFAVD